MEYITNPYMAMSTDFLLINLERNRTNPAEYARISQELRRRQAEIEREENEKK